MILATNEVTVTVPTTESAHAAQEVEALLKTQIQHLWAVHRENTAKVTKTKEEMKVLRIELGRSLFEMKAILVRTGRGGGWAAYLRAVNLPRATVNRYVTQHETSINPERNRTTDSFPETTASDVQRLVQHLLPRLRRVLTTASWVEWFCVEVAFQLETGGIASEPQSG